MASPSILTLRQADNGSSSLRDELISALADGQPRIRPGDDPADEAFVHTRRIPTTFLYGDRGLSIYEEITQSKSYYPFAAELEILQQYGDEIAARIFGLKPDRLGDEHSNEQRGSNDNEQEQQKDNFDHVPTPSAPKEKWGDASVGIFNHGVNGSSNTPEGKVAIGLAVELGSGSLEKTRHLLRSLAKILQASSTTKGGSPFSSIEYKALDLERNSLVSSLAALAEKEPSFVKTMHDASPRVHIGGLHADYWEGLAHLKDGASSNGSDSHGALASTTQTTSIFWLGSSIGNFRREDAVEFLKNVHLAPGDTMLIGIDSCDDVEMIETAYDDPEGVTRRFIFEGVDQAGRTLHGTLDGVGGLASKNFDYVSRYNQPLGRHEAYLRCKVEDLILPIPATKTTPASEIVLKKDELLHIEVSYKYTQAEALNLFHAAGFRLVQSWSDSRRLHAIYLLEQPAISFSSNAPGLKELGVVLPDSPYGLPTMTEWETMWKTWDMLSLEIIPPELLMTKPIPLRHIPLFYRGHLPAFCDIHISRYFDEPLTSPSRFADLFERGIDPDVEDPEKINHWHSKPPEEGQWPALEEILTYGSKVRERVRKVYKEHGEGKMTRRLARVLMMVFEHEAMHFETLVYIALQASNSLLPPRGFQPPDFPSLSREWARKIAAEGSSRRAILDFPATTIELGHDDDDREDDVVAYDEKHAFGWDVEHPKRRVDVEAFKIDALPVTNGEYLAYLSSLKAPSKDLFPASWASGFKATSPRIEASEIKVKTLYGEIDFAFASEWPLCASAFQLDSFAKFKGGRLPTRSELAVFFRQNPVDSPTSNIGLANLHPVPATLPTKQRGAGIGAGSDGGVWMWSSTILEAHEGYVASSLYPGYSSDFFDGQHHIIVGGSYVTPPRLARSTFTNWYQAKYPYVLAGARVAY